MNHAPLAIERGGWDEEHTRARTQGETARPARGVAQVFATTNAAMTGETDRHQLEPHPGGMDSRARLGSLV